MEDTSRPWREIARELACQTNHQRSYELAKELDKALEEQEGLMKPFLLEPKRA